MWCPNKGVKGWLIDSYKQYLSMLKDTYIDNGVSDPLHIKSALKVLDLLVKMELYPHKVIYEKDHIVLSVFATYDPFRVEYKRDGDNYSTICYSHCGFVVKTSEDGKIHLIEDIESFDEVNKKCIFTQKISEDIDLKQLKKLLSLYDKPYVG